MKVLKKRDIGVDERLGIGQSLFLGLQSVLACNLFLGPVVIIGALSMGVKDATAFGSVIPAAIVIIIVGFTGLFSVIVRKFIPPFVAAR